MLTDWILSKNLKKEKRKRKRNLLPRSKEIWSGCSGQKDRFIKEKRLSGSGKRRGEKHQVCWGEWGRDGHSRCWERLVWEYVKR